MTAAAYVMHRTDLVYEEWRDEHANQGGGKGPLHPCDPGGGDDNPHFCGQLQTQQVLCCCCEEKSRGVY